MRLLAKIKEFNEIILEIDVIEDSTKEEENIRLIIQINSYYSRSRTNNEESNNNNNKIIQKKQELILFKRNS